MAVSSVIGEVNGLLLKCFSADVTDVTEVFLVIGSGFAFLSETWKGVEHESANYVAEHGFKECDVDDIVDEANYLKLLHSLADCSRNVKLTYAIEHAITHRGWIVFWGVDIFHVVAESYGAENNSKDHSHYADED